MANPSDAYRDLIMRYLYNVHRTARGVSSLSKGIRDIQSEMKTHGMKQADVNSNLDYLVQKGWVERVVDERSFTTPRGTTQQSERVTYKISDVGIDRLEAASTYRRQDSFSKINITNIKGVTVVGTGNVVNTEFTDMSNLLAELEQQIATSDELDEENRLNALADVATIQSQLSKPRPDHRLIKMVWAGLEKVVTVGGLAELAAKIGGLIAGAS